MPLLDLRLLRPAALAGLVAGLAAFFAIASPPATAVEIAPGQVYEGGTSLTASNVGVTFAVPSGWRAGLPAGAEALVMERVAGGAMILVMAQAISESELRQEMSQNVDLGGGAFLSPLAPPNRRSDGVLTADYQLIGGQVPGQGAAYTRIGGSGVGVVFFAIDTGSERLARAEANRLIDRVEFSAPVVPEATVGEGAAAWSDYMRGRYLARFYTGSGYHEKTELWLCSDGTPAARATPAASAAARAAPGLAAAVVAGPPAGSNPRRGSSSCGRRRGAQRMRSRSRAGSCISIRRSGCEGRTSSVVRWGRGLGIGRRLAWDSTTRRSGHSHSRPM